MSFDMLTSSPRIAHRKQKFPIHPELVGAHPEQSRRGYERKLISRIGVNICYFNFSKIFIRRVLRAQ